MAEIEKALEDDKNEEETVQNICLWKQLERRNWFGKQVYVFTNFWIYWEKFE